MNNVIYLSKLVGLYREKESGYPLSLQQGEVAKVNARSDGERLHKQVSFDGRSVYTNNSVCTNTAGAAAYSCTCQNQDCSCSSTHFYLQSLTAYDLVKQILPTIAYLMNLFSTSPQRLIAPTQGQKLER
jgi:hypothetical protein